MLGAFETSTQSREHSFHVSLQQRRNVQPESRKNAALEGAVGESRDLVIIAVPQFPPEQAIFRDDPSQVLTDRVPAISTLFLMQVIGPRTADNFHNQFRRAFDVIIGGNP